MTCEACKTDDSVNGEYEALTFLTCPKCNTDHCIYCAQLHSCAKKPSTQEWLQATEVNAAKLLNGGGYKDQQDNEALGREVATDLIKLVSIVNHLADAISSGRSATDAYYSVIEVTAHCGWTDRARKQAAKKVSEDVQFRLDEALEEVKRFIS